MINPRIHGLCVVSLLLNLLALLPAKADLTIGADARMAGMGGAGLAVSDIQQTAANPAFLADSHYRFGIQMPSVTAVLDGISYNELTNHVNGVSMGAGDATTLAEDLGKQNVTFGANMDVGLLLPFTDINASATMRGEIEPSNTFSQWVVGGAQTAALANLTPAQVADFNKTAVEAAGVAYAPSVAFGFHVPGSRATGGQVSVGVRVKCAEEYYSKYQITTDGTNVNATPAPEMGGQNYLKSNSVAGDLGFLYTPNRFPNTHMALVIDNALEPKAISFADGTTKQITPCTYSIGFAQQVTRKFLVALDVVDLNHAYNTNSELRVGAEYRLLGIAALRGGYSSDTGYTVGIGFGSLGIAYSKTAPVLFSEAVTF